jgi:M6 family metalloprotease-like protein
MNVSRLTLEFLLIALTMSPAIPTTPASSASTLTASSFTNTDYNFQVISGKHTVTGLQRALIILAEFQDVHHTISPDQIKKVAVDQLNQYYNEVSRGRVSLAGDVYGWYVMNHPMSYYGHDSKDPGDDDNVRALAEDALAFLPSSVDVTSFKFLVVVHAGKDQADDQYNIRSDEIWSSCFCAVFPNYEHVPPVSVGSKTFASYAFLSEFNGVGTYAHEWGHLFGLPDLYDTENGDSYVGYWSLMDAGSRCCYNEAETTPSYIGAWGDSLLGWITPSVAETSMVVSSFDVNPLESSKPNAVLIPVSSSAYYFVEYRTRGGLDSHLPGSGILIYYVDERLESGGGILKLENPETGKLFAAQEYARDLNKATFQVGDRFRDAIYQVYLAFLAGENFLKMLFSKQELAESLMNSRIETSFVSPGWTYGDSATLSGTLLGEEGAPLAGQSVEIDFLNSTTNQWELLGLSKTGQQGEISFRLRLTFPVGEHSFRYLYPGGKIGDTWYASSSAEFEFSITPARMAVAVLLPSVIALDRLSIEVSAMDLDGQPLLGVVFNIYVDNVQRAIVETDDNGRASFELYFGLTDVGSHTVTAKASIANYLSTEVSESFFVIPPLLLIGAAAAMIVISFAVWRRRVHRFGLAPGAVQSVILCTRCGAELPPDSMYCLQCGARQYGA